jgi:hypothetical protein
MNVGHDIKELQKITAANTGVVEQYFEINNLLINPSKTHHILFQTKHSRQESNLKILIKNTEIVNAKSTNFLGVVIDNTLSWEDHVEKTCSRISRNLFLINRPSQLLEQNGKRMLHYGLIYPFLSYGIIVWGQSTKALTRRIFILQKRAVRYTAGLTHFESCKDSFRHLKILTVYSLYIQETSYM